MAKQKHAPITTLTQPLRGLLGYLARRPIRAVSALIVLCLAATVTLMLPRAIGDMIDNGFTAGNIDGSGNVFASLIFLALALAVFSGLRFYLVTSLGEHIVNDLRCDYFAKLNRLPIRFFDDAHSGDLISRLGADTTQIKSAMGAGASIAMRNLVMFFGACLMMAITSWQLSVVVLASIPLIILPLVGFGRMVRGFSRRAQDQLAGALSYASQVIGAIRFTKAYGHESHVEKRFGAAARQACEAAIVAARARALLTAIIIFIISASIIAVLWTGSSYVRLEQMSPGQLSQFLLYSLLAAGALAELTQVWSELSLAAGAAERIFEILAADEEYSPGEEETPSGSNIVAANLAAPAAKLAGRATKIALGAISFDNVNFRYRRQSDQQILEQFSLKVQPGENIAIVGPSGAGKSTIFHLLVRFYAPDSGQIRIDDTDISAMSLTALRQGISLISQDTAIFGASIAENIAYGRIGASRDDIIKAAATANAGEFIDNLENGYDTIIGERGITLSGGQRQRIALARAVLKNAPLFLMDEATSALDAQSERDIRDAMERLTRRRTTIIIAHRLATVRNADRIVVMDKGQIVEIGTHDSLMDRSGLYADLAKIQFDTGP